MTSNNYSLCSNKTIAKPQENAYKINITINIKANSDPETN